MELVEGAILVIAEDNNLTLGVVWIVVAVLFDSYAGHGWYGAVYVTFALEAAIILLVYHCLDIMIPKSLFPS